MIILMFILSVFIADHIYSVTDLVGIAAAGLVIVVADLLGAVADLLKLILITDPVGVDPVIVLAGLEIILL